MTNMGMIGTVVALSTVPQRVRPQDRPEQRRKSKFQKTVPISLSTNRDPQ
ncbi:MAG: hypothetical protein KDE51_16910 [Anaerolineales bacterium]|nr:hypothetical protein [Anaerolineales bacterium]